MHVFKPIIRNAVRNTGDFDVVTFRIVPAYFLSFRKNHPTVIFDNNVLGVEKPFC